MGNQRIKLRYVDTMSRNYKNEVLWQLLNQWFDIDEESEPDYVISGGMGTSFTKYKNCVLIQIIGENIVPDFNMFDYAIGFDYIDFGDRYTRVPLYVFYDSYQSLIRRDKIIDKQNACSRKFCSYVVSNANYADPTRDNFFQELCKYKRVDSAGRHLNNMGGGYLKDKMDFISNYKFNIAFENCASIGYTTEKIMEPMVVNTIPIYWGNPRISDDFNKESFVCLSDFDTVEACIKYIERLDNDDDLYYEKLSKSWFNSEKVIDYNKRLELFFQNIFKQDIRFAKRVNIYGRQSQLKSKLYDFYKANEERTLKNRLKKGILNFLRKD